MNATAHLQLGIDIVFFLTIFFLLWQLNRRVGHQRPPLDRHALIELEQIMTRSQEQTTHFLRAMEEQELRFKNMLHHLESKEKKLIMLIEQVDALPERRISNATVTEALSSSDRYDDILQMIQQGLSREEVAKRSGVTEDEINLVIQLFQARPSRR